MLTITLKGRLRTAKRLFGEHSGGVLEPQWRLFDRCKIGLNDASGEGGVSLDIMQSVKTIRRAASGIGAKTRLESLESIGVRHK